MSRARSFRIPILITVLICLLSEGISGQNVTSDEIDVTRCWYAGTETTPLTVAADNGHLFLGLTGAKVETLSRSGRKMWSSELGGAISSNLLPIGDSLMLVTSTTGSNGIRKPGSVLRSLSKETGVTNWTSNIVDAEQHFLHSHNGWIVVVSTNGSIHALDGSAGTVIWKREIASGFAARPAFTATSLLVASTTEQIFSIALSTGEITEMKRLPYPITAITTTQMGEFIAGDERGNISLLPNGTEKPDWKFKSGGQISSLVAVQAHVLAASHDNFVYYLVARSGNVAWKRRLAGRAAHVVNISDRYALLSSVGDDGATLIDLQNGKVAGTLPVENGESLSGESVFSDNRIFAITEKGAYGFSINGCGENKEGGLTN